MYNLIEQIPLTAVQLFEKYKFFHHSISIQSQNFIDLKPIFNFFDIIYSLSEEGCNQTADVSFISANLIDIADELDGNPFKLREFKGDTELYLVLQLNQLLWGFYTPVKFKIADFAFIIKQSQLNQLKTELIKARAVFYVESEIKGKYGDLQKIPLSLKDLQTKILVFNDLEFSEHQSKLIDYLNLDFDNLLADSNFISLFMVYPDANKIAEFIFDFESDIDVQNRLLALALNQFLFGDYMPKQFKIKNFELFMQLDCLQDYQEVLRINGCIFKAS